MIGLKSQFRFEIDGWGTVGSRRLGERATRMKAPRCENQEHHCEPATTPPVRTHGPRPQLLVASRRGAVSPTCHRSERQSWTCMTVIGLWRLRKRCLSKWANEGNSEVRDACCRMIEAPIYPQLDPVLWCSVWFLVERERRPRRSTRP